MSPAFEYTYTFDRIHVFRLYEPTLPAFDALFECQGNVYRDHEPGVMYRAVYDFRWEMEPQRDVIQMRFEGFYEHYRIPHPNRVVYVFANEGQINMARAILHASPNRAIRGYYTDVDAAFVWMREQAAQA